MKKIIIYISLLTAVFIGCSHQGSYLNKLYENTDVIENVPHLSFKSNPNLSLNKFLSGIKSIYVLTDEDFESTFSNYRTFFRKYSKTVKSYLGKLGYSKVAITQNEQMDLDKTAYLPETGVFKIRLDNTEGYISQISIEFKSCNGDIFILKKETDYFVDKNWDLFLDNELEKLFKQKSVYERSNQLVLKSTKTKWNEERLKDYFSRTSIDQVEGIYEKFGSSAGSINNYKLGLIKENDCYKLIYLNGAANNRNWKEGELKGMASNTAIKDFYKIEWMMSDKSICEDVYMSTNDLNFISIDFLDSDNEYHSKYLKVYPTESGRIVTSDNHILSGTGFLVSNDGYLVTNYHIIQNAKKISVEFDGNEKSQKYDAVIIRKDKLHDLAILQIKDKSFNQNMDIKYSISDQEPSLGGSVFTLGFPLVETLGESIKLTDGIISSKFGYMSDEKSYQLSIPINPGNSGGPLFDVSGNLVGIINARYSGAENVSYAIKSKYLSSLLEETDVKTDFTEINSLEHFTFTDLVEQLRGQVCLIKIYN